MINPNRVYHGEALDLLHAMQVEGLSADAVICDPMYGSGCYEWGRDPANGDPGKHWDYHQPIYTACRRVLKPGGVVAWSQGTKFLAHFGEWFGRHRVWSLTRVGLKNLLAVNNVWIVQTREQRPVNFPAADAVVVCDRTAYKAVRRRHRYTKPVEELEFLVRHLTQPNDLVVDCCCGLGSTLLACQRMGRRWIGCDLSQQYTHYAKHKLSLGGGAYA